MSVVHTPRTSGVDPLVHYACVGGHLDQLICIQGTMRVSQDTIDYAASKGHTEILEWLAGRQDVDGPVLPSQKGLLMAAAGGELHTLQWADSQRLGCWCPKVMDVAAWQGRHSYSPHPCQPELITYVRLDVVQWLHRKRGEGCTTDAMNWAAQGGHLCVVVWLHNNREEGCTTAAIDEAASRGHVDIVRWLHTHRSEGCTEGAIVGAAANGHVQVLQFLLESGTKLLHKFQVPIDWEAVLSAACSCASCTTGETKGGQGEEKESIHRWVRAVLGDGEHYSSLVSSRTTKNNTLGEVHHQRKRCSNQGETLQSGSPSPPQGQCTQPRDPTEALVLDRENRHSRSTVSSLLLPSACHRGKIEGFSSVSPPSTGPCTLSNPWSSRRHMVTGESTTSHSAAMGKEDGEGQRPDKGGASGDKAREVSWEWGPRAVVGTVWSPVPESKMFQVGLEGMTLGSLQTASQEPVIGAYVAGLDRRLHIGRHDIIKEGGGKRLLEKSMNDGTGSTNNPARPDGVKPTSHPPRSAAKRHHLKIVKTSSIRPPSSSQTLTPTKGRDQTWPKAWARCGSLAPQCLRVNLAHQVEGTGKSAWSGGGLLSLGAAVFPRCASGRPGWSVVEGREEGGGGGGHHPFWTPQHRKYYFSQNLTRGGLQ